MRPRYYHTGLKQFLNRDVVKGSVVEGQTLNRYAYVNGNPVSYVDPLGLSKFDAEGTDESAVDGREYAQVGDRIYRQHAVERMNPSGMRYSSESVGGKVGASRIMVAGQKDYGRSIRPIFF